MSSRISSGSIIALAAAVTLTGVAGRDIAAQGREPRSGCPADVGTELQRCAQEKIKTFNPPLTPDGRPDFSGYWSRVPLLVQTIEEGGPDFPEPRTLRARKPSAIVDPPDGRIPYQPWASEVAYRNWETYHDPQTECYLPGPVRFVYTSPGGYFFLQPRGDREIVMFTERSDAYQRIALDGRPHIPANIKLFQGDPVGRWDGNTLVIDITNVNGEAWFDHGGSFQSDAAHIVQRWTLIDPDVIHVESTITDPKIYTRPMKMAVAMVRIKEQYELLEYACWEGEQDLQHMYQALSLWPGVDRLRPGTKD